MAPPVAAAAVGAEAAAWLLERLEDGNLETERALRSALAGLAAQRRMLLEQRGVLQASALHGECEVAAPASARRLQVEALHGTLETQRPPPIAARPASLELTTSSFDIAEDFEVFLHGHWVDEAGRWYGGSIIYFDGASWRPLDSSALKASVYSCKVHGDWAELVETQYGGEHRRFHVRAGDAPDTLRVSCRSARGRGGENWILHKVEIAGTPSKWPASLGARRPSAAAGADAGPAAAGCRRDRLAGPLPDSHHLGRFISADLESVACSAASDMSEASDASEGADTDTMMLGHMRALATTRNLAQVMTSVQGIVAVKDVIIPRNCIQTWILPVLQQIWFNLIFMTLIIANIVCLGIEIDMEVKQAMHTRSHGEKGEKTNMDVVTYISRFDRFCLVMFIVEICVRLLGEQELFFCGPNRWWNLFEFCIIMSTGLDELLHVAHDNLASFRSLRVLRLCRIIRFFTFFRFLRMMLFSFLCCFGSLFWAILLVLVAAYVFAIYTELAVKEFINLGHDLADDEWEQFGGIDAAFKSLIYSISGGSDWADLVDLFWKIGWLHGWMYVGFVLFMMFGMLNIIVSVFVQETADILTWDRELVLDTSLNKQAFVKTQLRELFLQIDGIIDGVKHSSITMDELKEAMKNDRVNAFFAHLNIDLAGQSLVEFFRLLDSNNSGEVTMDEFVEGCMRFQGHAKPMVQANMERTLGGMSRRVAQLERTITSNWNSCSSAGSPAHAAAIHGASATCNQHFAAGVPQASWSANCHSSAPSSERGNTAPSSQNFAVDVGGP